MAMSRGEVVDAFTEIWRRYVEEVRATLKPGEEVVVQLPTFGDCLPISIKVRR